MCLFRITLPEKRSERPRSSPPSQPLPLPLIRGMISRVEPDELNFLRMAWSYVQSRRINQGGIWKPPGGLRIDVHVSQGNGYVRIASALIGNLDSQQIGASYLNFACAYLLESFLSRTAWHREGRISMQWLSEDEYTSRILYHETVNDWDEEHAMSADCHDAWQSLRMHFLSSWHGGNCEGLKRFWMWDSQLNKRRAVDPTAVKWGFMFDESRPRAHLG